MNDNNVCYECLDIKDARYHHSNKFGFCVKNYSHYSDVFDKLIVKGTNHGKFYIIILIQWILLVMFFLVNYLYCLSKYSFKGWSILTLIEIPFIYYFHSEWLDLGIYLFGSIVFYLSFLYFLIETICIIMNISRYELFYPNRCFYFYPDQNI